MGFLTNVSISNDFWHQIKENPQALVDAINVGMNDGIDGPISVALDERDAPEYRHSHRHYVKNLTPQGVTVHHARHYDEPQVIVNPYGHHAIAANELPYAINYGWLNGNEYRRKTAEATANVLEELAKDIRDSIRRNDAS